MGSIIGKRSEGNPADTKTKPNGAEAKPGASTGAASTEKRGAAGADTGTGTGTTAEKKELPKLVPVESKKPEPVKAEAPKPKRVRKKKEPEKQKVDTQQLNIMIATLSTVIASRPGCEMWKLSQAEIESITTPLGNMIANSEKLQFIGEHSDAFSLISALIIITVPRFILMAQKQKEKKRYEITGSRTDTSVKESHKKAENKPSVGNAGQQDAAHRPANDGRLSFLGDAIA